LASARAALPENTRWNRLRKISAENLTNKQ
jgi:hypothetical protein